MSVLYIVLPLALVLVAVAVAAFVWATHRGQFDDLDTPAMRVVVDDDGSPHVAGRAAASHDVTASARPRADGSAKPR